MSVIRICNQLMSMSYAPFVQRSLMNFCCATNVAPMHLVTNTKPSFLRYLCKKLIFMKFHWLAWA